MFAGKTNALISQATQLMYAPGCDNAQPLFVGLRAHGIKRMLDCRQSPLTQSIRSRTGLCLIDVISIYTDDDISEILALKSCKTLFIDEAQFLTQAQVNALVDLHVKRDIIIHAYGLRCDIYGQPFPGSSALMAVAHKLHELTSVCSLCGNTASHTLNLKAMGYKPHDSHLEAPTLPLPKRAKNKQATTITDTTTKPETFIAVEDTNYIPACYNCWHKHVYSSVANASTTSS